MKNPNSLSPMLGLLLALAMSSIAVARTAPSQLGTLTCALGKEASAAPEGTGLGREVVCQFRPGARGAEETYVGIVQFLGREGAIPDRGTIMMVVKASQATRLVPGLLEQRYTAEASGAGNTGKQAALVGQKDDTIILQSEAANEPTMALGQPVSVLIVVADLKLRSSPA